MDKNVKKRATRFELQWKTLGGVKSLWFKVEIQRVRKRRKHGVE